MIEKLYTIFLNHPTVSTDTRNIKPGCIFFALKGENFNGNKFAEEALNKGAAIAVIDEAEYKKDDRFFLVEDALTALQQLANHHRKQLQIPFIAITGSNGKTTTKELVNAVLSKKFKTLATSGNLNNHIGVPLTLLSVNKEHEIAIIEMGANHQGEINQLCNIAEPDYGIITNIGKAHLEGFGGIEGVKKGKGELYNFINQKKGKIFLHGDDETLVQMAGAISKITYGTKKLYDIVGNIKVDNTDFVSFQWATRYTASGLKTSTIVKTHLVGIYNYYNALCAIAVGNYFLVNDADISSAITEYIPSNNRSQLLKTEKNTLILDYYNANPSSMKSAIENFASLNHENKILILGDMLELGEDSAAEHEAIINLLKEKKLHNVILVGKHFKNSQNISQEKVFDTSEQVLNYLKQYPVTNNTVLIKGSRGIQLEKTVSAL